MVEGTIVDLFCGAGGMTVGFEKAGFEVIAAVDNNETALETYEVNHDDSTEVKKYDIRDDIPDDIGNLSPTGVVGGPPCKGFSDARGSRYVDDDRNGLVFEYIRWVSEIEPDFVVMENVGGILTISDDFMAAVEREFRDIGYSEVSYEVLDSSDYGVPQSRKRVILIAYSDEFDVLPTHPSPTHSGKQKTLTETKPKVGVWEAIKDLPSEGEEGVISLSEPTNEFLEWVHSDDDTTTNHIAKGIKSSGVENKIPRRLGAGEMYRSNRFGERYRQVWELIPEEFSDVERDCLRFIGKNRAKKEYKIKGKSGGHVDVRNLLFELGYSREEISLALDSLEERGWLRSEWANGMFGYDLNTKSGVRQRYIRLTPDEPSNTIMTTDFKPRDKLHPYEDRGLSLREGARLQSFPDDFEFMGAFDEVANQIGNAVPPRMIEKVAENIIEDL